MTQKSAKGHFLLIDLYDFRYFDVYLDGELAFQTYKESFEQDLFDFDNVTEWCEKTGLKHTDFRYTFIDVYGNQPDDYDCNDYMEELDKVLALNITPDFSEIGWDEMRQRYLS